MSRPGYVYILSNPSMPGLVKIGRSIHGGRSRAKDLYQTGVPTPFNLEFEILTEYPTDVEVLTHEKLSAKRVSDSREFFKVEADEAKYAVIECVLSLADMSVISADEAEAVEGAAIVASEANMLWIDACHAVGWILPEEMVRAHERRMHAIKNPAFKPFNEAAEDSVEAANG